MNNARNTIRILDEDKPLVSIIITAFNSQRTISKCVKCVLDQTYPKKEIIVVDNGSTDSTLQILQRFPVKLIQVPYGGVATVRNSGMKESKGDVICFLDHDNYVDSDWLNEVVATFKKIDVECVVTSNVRYVTDDDDEEKLLPHLEDIIHRNIWTNYKNGEKQVVNLKKLKNCPPNPWAFKREKLLEMELFDERFISAGGEDSEFFLRFFKSGGKLVFINTPVIHDHRFTFLGSLKRRFIFGFGYANMSLLHRNISLKSLLKLSSPCFGILVMMCLLITRIYLPLLLLALGCVIGYFYYQRKILLKLKWSQIPLAFLILLLEDIFGVLGFFSRVIGLPMKGKKRRNTPLS